MNTVILKAIHLYLFWRRNHLPSIVFKCLVWAALAWLVVSAFSTATNALICAAAAVIAATIHYTRQARNERKQLLAKLGDDPEKLAQMESMLNGKGDVSNAMFGRRLLH